MTRPTGPSQPAPPVPPPSTGVPSEEEIQAARRTAAQHRRRRHPDRRCCGFCVRRWEVGQTGTGKPSRGCVHRRQALEVLDVVGQLDELGRPIPGTGA